MPRKFTGLPFAPPRGIGDRGSNGPIEGSVARGRTLVALLWFVAGGCAAPDQSEFERANAIDLRLTVVLETEADSAGSVGHIASTGKGSAALIVSRIPAGDVVLWKYLRGSAFPASRFGAGPGEMRFVGSLTSVDNGALVFDPRRQAILAYDRSGQFEHERIVRRAAPGSAVIGPDGSLYWVEARRGRGTFFRLSELGELSEVKSSWPWRGTLRASRLLVIGSDSVLAFSDLTGCLGLVIFAPAAVEQVGCAPKEIRLEVASGAQRLFDIGPDPGGSEVVPTFPLEGMIQIGPRRIVLAVPEFPGRRATVYAVDLDRRSLGEVHFHSNAGMPIAFRPMTGTWTGREALLSDGHRIVRARVAPVPDEN